MAEQTPHDSLVKAVFGNRLHLVGELRAALPADVVERMDLRTLRDCRATFVDEQLADRHSDLLFGVELDGREVFLYVLVEHQSTPDPQMPFRMLRYVMRIWERWLAEQEPERQGACSELPVVIPLVLYHGRQPWTGPRSLHALVAPDPASLGSIAAYVPQLELLLDDLHRESDEALASRRMTPLGRMALLLLKHARGAQNLAEALAYRWGSLLQGVLWSAHGQEDTRLLMRYILVVNEGVRAEDLQRLLAEHVDPEAGEAAMTEGERLIERGMQQGLQQGMQQGLEEGRRELLQRQLQRRFGELSPEAVERLKKASASELDRWAERVLTAERLEDVFD